MNIKETASQIIDAYFNGELEERYETAGTERQTRIDRFHQGVADGELRRPNVFPAQTSDKRLKRQAAGGSEDGGDNKSRGGHNLNTTYLDTNRLNPNSVRQFSNQTPKRSGS